MKKAFTLAEVLITLGIIGVVAALVMPSLIAKNREKVAVAKLKKAYATISNAYILALQENGDLNTWFPAGSTRADNTAIVFNNIKPYLNISKDCGLSPGCFNPEPLKNVNGDSIGFSYDNSTYEYRFILADGSAWSIDLATPDCTSNDWCGSNNFKVDIDGFKGPNTQGKDFFEFISTTNRVYPAGIAEAPGTLSFKSYCNRLASFGSQSLACAAWVIYNENMDYLHCDDLDWGGKTKCD